MLELNFSQTLGNHCLTINETLPANGITAIFGVSGAGKTSLINAISGLTRPQKGRIVLNGRVLNDADKGICLTPEKRRVGYVFQDARLFPRGFSGTRDTKNSGDAIGGQRFINRQAMVSQRLDMPKSHQLIKCVAICATAWRKAWSISSISWWRF
ncbi:hypothetical protein EIMP300_68750 [Escherichia coli]|uniref:ABC transporter domain-containing protein n=1 Tax=Escherichia coli TaxID=562 RepID=A0A8S0FXS9_ECOLX|nr:hypothetical protein EIMP300_68750 [Escherichia coli]